MAGAYKAAGGARKGRPAIDGLLNFPGHKARMRETRTDPSVATLIGLARAIPALALTGLFTWMAYFVRGNGGREIDWFGPAFFAFICGVGAVWQIVRALSKPRGPGPDRETVIEPVGDPSFDPDDAIQRYLASKGPSLPAAGPDPSGPAAPRPTFGRKGV